MNISKELILENFSFKIRIVAFLFIISYFLSCETDPTKQESSEAIAALIGQNDTSQASEFPLLNDLTVNTFTVNGNEREFQVSFSFKNKPKNTVTTKAYIGNSNIMKLDDGKLNVIGYMQEKLTTDQESPNRFTFILPIQNLTYKIIVVAFNSNGKSSKEITITPFVTIPNPIPTPGQGGPLPTECQGAIAAPTTIGNCAGHCIQVTKNGTVFEFLAKNTTASANEYLYIDVGIGRPSGVPISFNFREFGFDEITGDPIPGGLPAGTYMTPMIQFNFQNYDKACVSVSSYRMNIADYIGGGNFTDGYIEEKIIVAQ